MRSQFLSRTFLKIGIVAVACSFGAASAFALTPDGSDSNAASIKSCAKGEIYNSHSSKCQTSSSGLDNKELYTQGRDLALAGRYDEALTALKAVTNDKDAMVLTMLGYTARKMGNYDDGLAYYQRALVIEPNNVNTHEYLGEAYAEKGKLDLAKAELEKISAACGSTTCEAYKALTDAIAGKPDAKKTW
jgi:tetratricopeptide (TPR) repeat protein